MNFWCWHNRIDEQTNTGTNETNQYVCVCKWVGDKWMWEYQEMNAQERNVIDELRKMKPGTAAMSIMWECEMGQLVLIFSLNMILMTFIWASWCFDTRSRKIERERKRFVWFREVYVNIKLRKTKTKRKREIERDEECGIELQFT